MSRCGMSWSSATAPSAERSRTSWASTSRSVYSRTNATVATASSFASASPLRQSTTPKATVASTGSRISPHRNTRRARPPDRGGSSNASPFVPGTGGFGEGAGPDPAPGSSFGSCPFGSGIATRADAARAWDVPEASTDAAFIPTPIVR